MTPRYHYLLTLAVETGVTRGVNRAYKHTDAPSREAIIDEVETEVMNEISEYFVFETEE